MQVEPVCVSAAEAATQERGANTLRGDADLCVFPVSGLATMRRAAGSSPSPGPRPIDRESQVQAGFAAGPASAATGPAASAPCLPQSPFFFDASASPTRTLATRFAANASMAAAARAGLREHQAAARAVVEAVGQLQVRAARELQDARLHAFRRRWQGHAVRFVDDEPVRTFGDDGYRRL